MSSSFISSAWPDTCIQWVLIKYLLNWTGKPKWNALSPRNGLFLLCLKSHSRATLWPSTWIVHIYVTSASPDAAKAFNKSCTSHSEACLLTGRTAPVCTFIPCWSGGCWVELGEGEGVKTPWEQLHWNYWKSRVASVFSHLINQITQLLAKWNFTERMPHPGWLCGSNKSLSVGMLTAVTLPASHHEGENTSHHEATESGGQGRRLDVRTHRMEPGLSL